MPPNVLPLHARTARALATEDNPAPEHSAELTPLLSRSSSSASVADTSFTTQLATWKRKFIRADKRAWLGFYLPIMHWLPRYDIKNHAMRDLLAGIAISMMLIPQGLGTSPSSSLLSSSSLHRSNRSILPQHAHERALCYCR